MSPRPILKSLPALNAASSSLRTGRVHFPPTPSISATYLTHSGRSYDRSAIVVSPNECALPERHCPARTYVLSEGKGEGRLLKNLVRVESSSDDNEHEDAITPAAGAPQRTDYFSVIPPSLTPDITSESENSSDGLSPPPPDDVHVHRGHPPIPFVTLSIPNDLQTHRSKPSPERIQSAVSFLPHPLPPVRERKRSLSPHNPERKKEKAHCFSGGESGFVSPRRRTLSFTPDVPPDVGCLGGF